MPLPSSRTRNRWSPTTKPAGQSVATGTITSAMVVRRRLPPAPNAALAHSCDRGHEDHHPVPPINGVDEPVNRIQGRDRRSRIRPTAANDETRRFVTLGFRLGMGVELAGIEPATPCLQSRCSDHLSYSPHNLRLPPAGSTDGPT